MQMIRHLTTAALILICLPHAAFAGDVDLALAKSDGGVAAILNTPIIYSLSVMYVTGSPGSVDLVVTETVPAFTTFVPDLSDPGWVCATPSAGSSCFFSTASGPVPNDLEFAVVVDAAVPVGTAAIVNTATVSAGSDSDPSNNTVTIQTPFATDLALDKSDGDITAFLGEPIVYTLNVTYVTGSPDSVDFVIQETIPAHTTYLSDQSDPGWSCQGPSPGQLCEYSTASGPVPEDLAFAVLVDAAVPPDAIDIVNTATIATAGDSNPANDTVTISTPLTVPVELMSFTVD